MRPMRWLTACAFLTSLVACGGGAGEAGSSNTASSGQRQAGGATAKDKQPSWKLGHFSSHDGLTGAVIDRTGDKPKIRIDGTKDIVELFLEKQTDHHGDSRGHWLNGPEGKHWVFLGEHGELQFVKPDARAKVEDPHHDTWAFISFSRDADADPLGAPTSKGVATPPAEKSPYELFLAKLEAASVVKKLTQYKPEDSGNLAKVAEAFQKADPSMFVHTTAKAHASWEPASGLIDNTNHAGGGGVLNNAPTTDEVWDKNKPGIQKYGVFLKGYASFNDPSRIRLGELKGWPPPLAANTPGMVWGVFDGTVVFVTLDGGRYRMGNWASDFPKDGPSIEPGLGSPASWPAPLQHSVVDVGVVNMLVKGGAITSKAGEEIVALEEAYFKCTQNVWKEGRAEGDKLEASQGAANEKFGALSGIRKKYELKAEKDCAGTVTKYEQGLVKFIETRNAERLANYEKAKARAK